MQFDKLVKAIESFKQAGTKQSWLKDNHFTYENDYLSVIKIESSNVAGGDKVNKGKQWSIIFYPKKDFSKLQNWHKLKCYFTDSIKITNVRGATDGKCGIRLYKMSSDPTIKVVQDFLAYIFE
ncbi:MAG: hypothetical protein WDA00_04285 [Eubacteriales bacterium]